MTNSNTNTVAVFIKGPQGSGKTVIGKFLAEKLREIGAAVDIFDDEQGFVTTLNVTGAVSGITGESK